MTLTEASKGNRFTGEGG
uniref:Uncharacterized protein n=1 Tax=Anguilla anguilla TaxID=7936 RepID=A0A0E9VU89_ANGAN